MGLASKMAAANAASCMAFPSAPHPQHGLPEQPPQGQYGAPPPQAGYGNPRSRQDQQALADPTKANSYKQLLQACIEEKRLQNFPIART
jgi:hypothetical protein